METTPTDSIVHSLTRVSDFIRPVANKIYSGLKKDGYTVIPTDDIDYLNYAFANPTEDNLSQACKIVGTWE